MRPRAVQNRPSADVNCLAFKAFSIMTKSIDLLALIEIRVGMPQGPWDAPGNEPAGAFQDVGAAPRARLLRPGCEELRRLAKGCPAPKQTSGQPPITHGRVANPEKKKCSLGLQVRVFCELGLFCPALPSCFCSTSLSRSCPNPGRAGFWLLP